MSEGFNGAGDSSPMENAESEAAMREYAAPAAGVELFVKEMGSGPPVVVLHGGPGAHHDYLIQAFDPLADDFRLYFYDQRGGGRSRVRQLKTITWRQHVADLEALRVGWGLERLAVLGYSWGGLLALLHATEHPDRVSCMVLVDPAAGWDDYQERFKAEFDARMTSEAVARMWRELDASGLRRRDPEAFRKRRFELSVAGYFRDPSEAVDLTPFRVQGQVQAATWASLEGYGDELRNKVASLEQPTLILHGRHDPMPLDWARELEQTLASARLVVLENSGHVPYAEEPEATLAEIRAFFRDQLST